MSRDYPFNVIPLFPEKIETAPLEHPVVKEFLADIAVHTDIHSHEVEDEDVLLVWLAGDANVLATINVRTRLVQVTAMNDDNNEILAALLEVGPDQKNRWLGYWIDDKT